MSKQPVFALFSTAFVVLFVGCEDGKRDAPASAKPELSSMAPAATPEATPATNPQLPTVSAIGDAPEFTVSAEQLAKDFAADKDAALTKYLKKTVRVNGKVRATGKDESGVPIVELTGDGVIYVRSGIGSIFRSAVAELKEGQDTAIVGEIDGFEDNEIGMQYGALIR